MTNQINPAELNASMQALLSQAQEGAKVWMKTAEQMTQEYDRQVQAGMKMVATLQEQAVAHRANAVKLVTDSMEHCAAMAQSMADSVSKVWASK